MVYLCCHVIKSSVETLLTSFFPPWFVSISYMYTNNHIRLGVFACSLCFHPLQYSKIYSFIISFLLDDFLQLLFYGGSVIDKNPSFPSSENVFISLSLLEDNFLLGIGFWVGSFLSIPEKCAIFFGPPQFPLRKFAVF